MAVSGGFVKTAAAAVLSLWLFVGAASNMSAAPAPSGQTAEEEGSTLVLIPGGAFLPLYAEAAGEKVSALTKKPIGPENASRRPVKVKPFYLQRFPVTKAEFREFLRAHPEWRRSAIKPIFADSGYLKSWRSDTAFDSREKEPVTEISWFSAKAYCKSRGQRLPTIQEWEYAARASETKIDGTGDEVFLARILNWYARHDSETPEVGVWKNFYGVYDMHGLIWEWVADFNSALITGESRSDAQSEKNLFCGGGALFASEKQKRDYAAFMRFGFRSSLSGQYSLPQLGFRCAKDVPDTQG